jgi:monoamine oxidase
MQKEKQTEVLDVAIVGGGVSGIYTGWRLLTGNAGSGKAGHWKKQSGGLNVAIFEGTDRVGGRLLSARPPGTPHVTCEIGGMRFLSSQALVDSLVRHRLKLPVHPQVVDRPSNIAYLRGMHLRMDQLAEPDRLPYHLTWAEQQWLLGKDGTPGPQVPSSLIAWAVSQLLPEVTKLQGEALQQYLETAEIDGIPLYRHGFWNLLARSMSLEAYSLCRTTVGYDSLGMNANAVDLCREYFDFTPGTQYFLLDDGYESLPWTLESEFKEAGGRVVMNSWVRSFDAAELPDGTTGIAVQFNDCRPTVFARSIVLAMPQRSLERLGQIGPVMDPAQSPHMRTLMDAVEPVSLQKLFVTYPYPWWRQVGVTEGRSLTDLPVRQCYYWAVEGEQKGADKSNTQSVLMAYNDVTSSEFWGGLRTCRLGPHDAVHMDDEDTSHFHRPPVQEAESQSSQRDWSKRLEKNWSAHPAPKEMLREMHRQLCVLHGVSFAPEPIDAAFMDWSDDPFGAGVHFWNPGYRSWDVLQSMTQPLGDFPCYVCGEAYSTNQTWVEGALQTAEIVLQKRLGLPPPDWLKAEGS